MENPFSLYTTYAVFAKSEGQVVSALTLGSRSRTGERSVFWLRCCTTSHRGCKGSRLHRSCTILCRINLAHIESTDIVEPTAVVFMGIDVKRYQNLLANLYVETGKTVCSKDFKDHLLGILLVCLDDIAFHFPFTSCRSTTAFRSFGNHFSL